MATSYNDGTIPVNSITITIDGVVYVCDDFNIERPTKSILRTDQNDEPSGGYHYKDVVNGTATVQYLTKYPAAFETFTVTVDAVIGAETFIVLNVGDHLVKGQERKVPITFTKKYN